MFHREAQNRAKSAEIQLKESEFGRRALEEQLKNLLSNKHNAREPIVRDSSSASCQTLDEPYDGIVTACSTQTDDVPSLSKVDSLQEELLQTKSELSVARAVAAVSISTPETAPSMPTASNERPSIFQDNDLFGQCLADVRQVSARVGAKGLNKEANCLLDLVEKLLFHHKELCETLEIKSLQLRAVQQEYNTLRSEVDAGGAAASLKAATEELAKEIEQRVLAKERVAGLVNMARQVRLYFTYLYQPSNTRTLSINTFQTSETPWPSG